MDKMLAKLAERVEAALMIDDALADEALAAVRTLSPACDMDRRGLDSVDAVLALIHDVRPGWSVSIRGNVIAPNGHWRCTLRKSSGRDNDEYLGVGRGPTLAHALLASLLKAMAFAAG